MKILLFCVCLLLVGNFCFAELAEQHPIDKFESESIKQDWTTAGMANATVKATKMWEEEMNKYYELLKQELNRLEKEQLIKSQQSWLVFYKEEIKNVINVFGHLNGSMYVTMRAANSRGLVKTRALDLKHYYELIIENGS